MELDTPATIAILGAGPIGLEAALYARFLGYDVELYDRGEVAENVRRWGNVRMNSPFAMISTPLALAALAAQDENYRPPEGEAILTGPEWIDRYLEPLSQTDLIADHLRLQTEVVSVARVDPTRDEPPNEDEDENEQEDEETEFQITCRKGGHESLSVAHVVIDATGVILAPRSAHESFDEIIANVDYSRPFNFLIGTSATSGTQVIQPTEPNYYLLGSKAALSREFLVREGHQQIRALFAQIGGRAELDLYRGMKNLVPGRDV